MSTRRLPPSHAPAHGRRQDGGTTVPGGPGATDGAARGRRVGQQGRTADVTQGLAEADSSAEDRAKKRRRTEEEHRLFVAERREVHTRSRRRVLRSVETRLDDGRTNRRETGEKRAFASRASSTSSTAGPTSSPAEPARRTRWVKITCATSG